jgi:Methylenetetrahydrofolate reductase
MCMVLTSAMQADDQAVRDYGVELSVDIIRTLRSHGIQGFHLCTLNLEKSIRRIVTVLDWVSEPALAESRPMREIPHNRLIAVRAHNCAAVFLFEADQPPNVLGLS